MSEQCVFCGAVYWREEKNTAHKYTKCCNDGKVQLPAFPDAPELLKALLTENSPDAKNYRQRIQEYNSALAFASMGAQIKLPRGTGPYCYRLHGQVYHRVYPCMQVTNIKKVTDSFIYFTPVRQQRNV
ncbi:hypothetical protein AVEN_35179-1 [Araneus ventricosus]|uniref:Helitron helicase-like domain-containing protein n=1 Tax=Araneus ventricosus TaxID=182803 RepID=A0A4Y2T508_ARAVE|nr:hypothetical protein AVEN_35179-1 [Araneus ventricosus]